MPRVHEHISFVFSSTFRDIFSLSFLRIRNKARGTFFPLQSYSKKTLRKNVPKSARKYKRNELMPPGHPIILLKSN